MAVYVRTLTDEERAQLEDWQSDPTIRPALKQRALAMLLSSQGYKTPAIAEKVDLHPLNVRKWIHRFNEDGLEGLHDRPRCGRPPKLDMNLRYQIWEIVATDPRALGCSYDTWTATRLMRYLRRADLIDGISYESIRQLFKEAQVVVDMIGKQPPAHSPIPRLQSQRERASRPAFLAAGTT
jgi:transposase